MIILFGSEKGGTGKTTLATNFAALMVSNGNDVLLIDTDKQGSASTWCELRDENKDVKRVSCIQKFGLGLANDIRDLARRYSHIIIDAGGRDNVEFRVAMSVADKIFIPLHASQFDIWTLASMDNLLNLIKAVNPNLKAFVVINKASTHPCSSEAKDMLELSNDLVHIQILSHPIRDRVAYRKAAHELEMFYNNVRKINEQK